MIAAHLFDGFVSATVLAEAIRLIIVCLVGFFLKWLIGIVKNILATIISVIHRVIRCCSFGVKPWIVVSAEPLPIDVADPVCGEQTIDLTALECFKGFTHSIFCVSSIDATGHTCLCFVKTRLDRLFLFGVLSKYCTNIRCSFYGTYVITIQCRACIVSADTSNECASLHRTCVITVSKTPTAWSLTTLIH